MKFCRMCKYSKWLGNQLYCTCQTTFLIKKELRNQETYCKLFKCKEHLKPLIKKFLEIECISYLFETFTKKDLEILNELAKDNHSFDNYDLETTIDLSESINEYLKERDKVLK